MLEDTTGLGKSVCRLYLVLKQMFVQVDVQDLHMLSTDKSLVL